MSDTSKNEIKLYIQMIFQWSWLIILFMLFGLGGGFVLYNVLPKTYTSSADILVGDSIFSTNPTTEEIEASEGLALVYVETIKNPALITTLIETFNLDWDRDDVWDAIDVSTVRAILTIEVSTPKPDLSLSMTEEIVRLLTENQTIETKIDIQIQLIDVQLDSLNDVLIEANNELSTITTRLNTPGLNALEEQLLKDRRSDVEETITLTLFRIGDLRNVRLDLEELSTTNIFTQVQPPELADEPDGVSQIYFMALLGLIGIFVGLVTIVLIKTFDTSINSLEYITNTMQLRVLGEVPRFGPRFSRFSRFRGVNHLEKRIVTNPNISVKALEAYRFIVAKLVTLQKTTKTNTFTYMLTSPRDRIGTTTTTVNLALVLATAGYRVLLINIDSRKEIQAEYGALGLEEAANNLLFDTDYPNLKVMRIDDVKAREQGSFIVLRQLRNFVEKVDQSITNIILVDTPSMSKHADAILLSGVLDTNIILVLELGKVNRQEMNEVRDKFPTALGAIINRQ